MKTVRNSLDNAKFNLKRAAEYCTDDAQRERIELGLRQLHNALLLLDKGYDLNNDDVSSLLYFTSVDDIPSPAWEKRWETHAKQRHTED